MMISRRLLRCSAMPYRSIGNPLEIMRGKMMMMMIQATSRRAFTCTTIQELAMKPGEPLSGLRIYKDKDPPIVKERNEYPDWVGSLAKPMDSLAKLRRMPDEEATDKDFMRFFKLTRRQIIRQRNEGGGK